MRLFFAPGPFYESSSLSWQGSIASVIRNPRYFTGYSFVPSKGWAEMIRKVYEVDPLLCSSCGGWMSIISFIDEHKVIRKIIRHLELNFEAERPPPPHYVQQELLMAAEEREEYF